jgi:hypothetical protein
MTSYEQKVGKVIRVEWDQDTDTVRLIMEITDPRFKSRVIHSKSYEDIMSISGKDVMIIASKSKKDEKTDNI